MMSIVVWFLVVLAQGRYKQVQNIPVYHRFSGKKYAVSAEGSTLATLKEFSKLHVHAMIDGTYNFQQ